MIVLRDGARGVEVFCVRRHLKSGFLGGAVVFPGGKVDASDGAEEWNHLASEPHPRASAFEAPALSARTLAVAACRETLEEGAIVPVEGSLNAPALEDICRAIKSGQRFAEVLAARGLRLALDALIPWSRWITPEAESRRFDARFFLLALPEGQIGRHDEHETTMSFWATPSDVLDRFERGELFLAPPTTRSLALLTDAPDLKSAVALAVRQSLCPICPRFVAGEAESAPYLALPGDPSHEVQEIRIDGPTRFVLRDGIFVSVGAKIRGNAYVQCNEDLKACKEAPMGGEGVAAALRK